MINATTLANLGRLMPNPEPITLRSKTGEGAYTSYAIAQAQRSALEQNSLIGGKGKREVQRTSWRIMTVDLNAANAPAPKIGDILVDAAGVSYVVQEADSCLMGQSYNCETKAVLS